jgi:hypothetical protein
VEHLPKFEVPADIQRRNSHIKRTASIPISLKS